MFKFSGCSQAEPFFGCLMRFHFVRHGRRGLSNEVADICPASHNEMLSKLESRILERLFSFLKVFSWVIPKSDDFDESYRLDEVSSGLKRRFCKQKSGFPGLCCLRPIRREQLGLPRYPN